MIAGNAAFVLHTHLPYCRLAGRWPHGEEWLHEAMLECYLPLVRALRQLAREVAGPLGVTINVTPILAEQIADPLMQEHFREYMGGRIRRAREDEERFRAGGGLRAQTAIFHRRRYEATQRLYEDELKGAPLAALAALEASGHIEIATSAATHGYLPLLDNEAAVRFQVKTGVETHERHFGRPPRSFWLPECAYEPGLERYLEEAGIQVFFVETHLVTGGRARGKAAGDAVGPYGDVGGLASGAVELPAGPGTTFRAYGAGASRVAVMARNERTGRQVWSARDGYPGDGAYREFHKKDGTSGLHYWRVTGEGIDLGDKAEYDPDGARAVARDHAAHFHGVIRSEMAAHREGSGEPGIVLMAYDTELFGHWWLEGIDWLEDTIRSLAADREVELASAADYVANHRPGETITLPEGSWGLGGDHRTWLNPATEWTWPEIHGRQLRAGTMLKDSTRATRQLARELLLLQSSDWQFLMTTGQAHDYAVERFQGHLARFDRLAAAIETRSPTLDSLVDEIEALDNPFPTIDPALYAAGAPIAGR